MTNQELDDKIRPMVSGNPGLGYRNVVGHLRSKGHFVQEKRVQQSLQCIDPAAVAMRYGIWNEKSNI